MEQPPRDLGRRAARRHRERGLLLDRGFLLLARVGPVRDVVEVLLLRLGLVLRVVARVAELFGQAAEVHRAVAVADAARPVERVQLHRRHAEVARVRHQHEVLGRHRQVRHAVVVQEAEDPRGLERELLHEPHVHALVVLGVDLAAEEGVHARLVVGLVHQPGLGHGAQHLPLHDAVAPRAARFLLLAVLALAFFFALRAFFSFLALFLLLFLLRVGLQV